MQMLPSTSPMPWLSWMSRVPTCSSWHWTRWITRWFVYFSSQRARGRTTLHIQPERNHKKRVVRLLLSFFKHQLRRRRWTKPCILRQIPWLDLSTCEPSIHSGRILDQIAARRHGCGLYLGVGIYHSCGSRLDYSSPRWSTCWRFRQMSQLLWSWQLRRHINKDSVAWMHDCRRSWGGPSDLRSTTLVRRDRLHLNIEIILEKRMHWPRNRQSRRSSISQPSVFNST
mgnify:CR=1 FL=1